MIDSTEKLTVPFLVLFVALGASGTAPAEALASDFQLKPSLSLSEEYNDNIFDTATGKRSDFITRVQPGASILYHAPSLSGDLAYNFDYQYYAKGSKNDQKNHYLAAHGSAALTENFFFLDVSDTLSRVSLDLARNTVNDSLFLNQTDQNLATASPYLLWHPGEKMVLKTGYRFTDTRYLSSLGIDKREHRAYAELNYGLSERWSLNASYSFSKFETDIGNYNEHDVSGGFRFEYADKSFLFGGIGNSWQDFSGSNHASNLFWNGGVTNDFGLLVATVETRVQYAEDPLTSSTKQTSYSVQLNKTLQHGSLGVSGSYAEYVGTQSDLFDRKSLTLGGQGSYEISPRLTATIAASGDRVRGQSTDDFPYHFNGSFALSRGFNYDITATLTYTYIDYRRQLDSSVGSRETNRVVLGLNKVF